MTKQEAKQQIAKLVEKYEKLVAEKKVNSLNEAQTRNEFIEPLFEFLGWDMRNLENPGEVTTEETVSKGRVDLAFRLNHIPVMFLEAKALRVDLDEWKWAEQAINYSWNKSVTWAILTDFEGIKVFNAEIPPKSLSQNLFFELKWDEYLDRFDQLWLLSKESFEEKRLAEQAEKWGKLTKRKQVGEKLFGDLTNWREKLTKDFKKNNNINEDALDEGVQKVLDRLIFIRTAEDREIEQNILLSLLREWETAGGKHNIYKRLVDGFRWFDEHYNSKLFTPHALESWDASNETFKNIINGLYKTADGYRYDFSAISTDVLGGIYEQYLGYVQEKTQKGDKGKKSKRKAQGIYYTPKYIVEYLIEQTLGEVLKKAKKKDLPNIKILDPACGSGSFLISAYDKMLEAKDKLESQTGLFDKFEILKQNIYGVDLDEQAIEIARLNLLLRVLSRRTKLPTLSHNIRMGNSLVDGETDELEKYFGDKWRDQKAFNWKQEFSEVFEQGGFDVIIGNPPYVRQELIKESKPYFEKAFPEVYVGTADLFVYFFERAMELLKVGGYFGFIVSNKFIRSGYGKNLRKYLQDNFSIEVVVDKFEGKVFKDATVDPCIIVIKKIKPRGNHSILYNYKIKVLQSSLSENGWTFASNNILKLKEKIDKVGKKIKDWEGVDISFGIKSGFNKAFIIDEEKKNELVSADKKSDKIIKPLLRGRDINRYGMNFKKLYLIKAEIGIDIEKYKAVYAWLEQFKEQLLKRTDYKKDIMKWYHLRPCTYYDEIEKSKIIYPDISEDGGFYLDKEGFYFNNTIYMISGSIQKSWIGVLNSRLMRWYYRQIATTLGASGVRYFTQFVKLLPIPEKTDILDNQVDLMLDLQKELQQATANTDKHARLKTEIEKLDQKIDQVIYKLYKLTNEEIKIIEK